MNKKRVNYLLNNLLFDEENELFVFREPAVAEDYVARVQVENVAESNPLFQS